MKPLKLSRLFVALFLLLSPILLAQENPATAPESVPGQPAQSDSEYVLGPGDTISLRVLHLEEISDKPVRIGNSGNIKLPMIGQIKVSGMTAEELEAEIGTRLKDTLNEPQVSVNITDYRSQPVSIIGWVNKPGVVQLEGRKTLFEVLSLADGVKPEAGYSVKITRRREFGKIPLPNAVNEDSGRYSVATVNLNSIMEATKPEENILICPFDVISVPKGETVYVIGDVRKPGGIILSEQKTITALQALSMAEGLEKTATPQKARILRPVPGADIREEVPVDLKVMLAGGASDVALKTGDILFIPGRTRPSFMQSLMGATSMATSIAIIARY